MEQLHLGIILFAFIFTSNIVLSERQVTLTCGSNDEIKRGIPGVPGKKGPIGIQGLKGEPGAKGDKGQTDSSRAAIKKLEQELLELEQKFSRKLDEAIIVSMRLNCKDVMTQGGHESGVYKITVARRRVEEVYCDLETQGGGWMIIQHRINGSLDFNRNWQNYTQGFGSPSDEFWIGLDTLHDITSARRYELRVDAKNFDNSRIYARYSSFSVSDRSSNYRLNISGYSGNTGNNLLYYNNQPFSAMDRDNDPYSGHCSVECKAGGFWFATCGCLNPNGQYLQTDIKGVRWRIDGANKLAAAKELELKIRPV